MEAEASSDRGEHGPGMLCCLVTPPLETWTGTLDGWSAKTEMEKEHEKDLAPG